MAKKSARTRKGRAFAWKLLLIPFALGFYWLLEHYLPTNYNVLAYPAIGRFADAIGNGEYFYNMLTQGLWVAGLALLIFAPVSKRWLMGIGFVLFLMPVWYTTDVYMVVEGAHLIKTYEFISDKPGALIKLLFQVTLALWALVAVKGGNVSEWLKLPFSLALMAGNLYCARNGGPLDWRSYAAVLAYAALTGWAVDLTVNGFDWGSLLPAAVGMLGLLIWGVNVNGWIITLAAAGIGAVVLICLHPARKRRWGSIALLAGMAVNCCLTIQLINRG